MKITSVKVIKQGTSAKTNKPWTLVSLSFEGKQGEHSGFLDNAQIGQDLEVEFYQEEYNGNMQNKFRALSKKDVEVNHNKEALMRIEKYLVNTNHKVNMIYKHLGIEEVQYAGNTNVPYVTPEQEGIDITRSGMVNEDINPEDIPFN